MIPKPKKDPRLMNAEELAELYETQRDHLAPNTYEGFNSYEGWKSKNLSFPVERWNDWNK